MIYLSIPYTHKDPAVREERFRIANRIAAGITELGLHVFSPISHGHPIALASRLELPTDWKYWEDYDRAMLGVCDTIAVVKAPGWRESIGVQAEIKIAAELGLRRHDIDPDGWFQ